ncbi:hypothetical protein WJT86_07165 [Microvirga sp. W0021]|uniref:Uncharacterized protein n=1 Tax=Hohaiivirga grylli TaxID=3133970 RepID=A0ABV0BIN1_9HYPH
MTIRFSKNKGAFVLSLTASLFLFAGCTPKPSERYMLSSAKSLQQGGSRVFGYAANPDRKELAGYLADAMQACLINSNSSYSGMVVQGPKFVKSGTWQIVLADPNVKAEDSREVVVTVGNPPERVGILKYVPKEVSMGKVSIGIKRTGAVNRSDLVIGIVMDTAAGLAPCAAVPATGMPLGGNKRTQAPNAGVIRPTFVPPPSPMHYPKFYR